MRISFQQIIVSVGALLVAIGTVIYISQNPVALGNQPLVVRALLLSAAVLAALVAVYPFNPLFNDKPGVYGLVVCLPSMIPGFFYFLFLLPAQAGQGMVADQLSSQLITDNTSNGIIEVGFSYPIFTPTISVKNQELFTKQVNVFLRMIDANGDDTLFRGVRQNIPGNSLSVESTVQGMLSRNEGYLFNPLALPPNREVSGKVVFIISNLEDGTTFNEALGRAYQAQFELRDPADGRLLLEFPLDRI